MKVIIKLFFIVGIAFWGIGLLYSFSQLVALNGLGDIFEMKEAKEVKTKIIRDSIDISILYTYKVNTREYSDKCEMFVDYYERCNINTLVIKYNKFFPMISHIDGIPIKLRKQKTGIFISTFFLLFLILIWKFSNRDKWEKINEEAGNRP